MNAKFRWHYISVWSIVSKHINNSLPAQMKRLNMVIRKYCCLKMKFAKCKTFMFSPREDVGGERIQGELDSKTILTPGN